MRRRRKPVLLALTVLALAIGPRADAGAAPVAWIANVDDGTVSKIDLDTHEAATIAVGTFPWGVAASPDGLRAYVANVDDGTVSVIDATVPEVVDTLPVGERPRGIAVMPDGTKVYAALSGGDVVVIDAATLTVGPTISLVPEFSFGSLETVAMSPSGDRVYVAKQENGLGSVAVIDTATDAFVVDVLVNLEGFQLYGVAVSADGTRVWATSEGAAEVAEIDATTNLWVRDIPLDCTPGCGNGLGLVPHPDGTRLYVAVQPSDRIAVIDTAAGAEVNSIALPGGPFGVDVTPDGSRLYVPNIGAVSRIEIIDTASETIAGALLSVGELPVGIGRFIVGDAPDEPVPPPPVLESAARSCQDAVAGSWKRFPAKVHKTFVSCFKRVLADVASGAGTAAAAAACDKSLDPADPTSSFARTRATARAKLLSDCVGVTPTQLAKPCAPGASTIAEVADCVLDAQTVRLTETLAAEYGSACSVATAAGLAAAFPGLCAPSP
jgi:YVTN family beta-propeller protein